MALSMKYENPRFKDIFLVRGRERTTEECSRNDENSFYDCKILRDLLCRESRSVWSFRVHGGNF